MPLFDQEGVFMAKQLSLPERIVIEQMIHKDYSFASIGRNLDRSAYIPLCHIIDALYTFHVFII